MTAGSEVPPQGGVGSVSLPHACKPDTWTDASGSPATTGAGAEGRARPRLIGIDAARGIALLGMMSVHLIDSYPLGETSWAWAISAGKSAALFALLAGVGVALASGGTHRPTGRRWTAQAASLTVRALMIGSVGLVLGYLVPADFAAIILPYYALLFLLAIPLLSLSVRALVVLAAVIALGMPVLSQVVRAGTEVLEPTSNVTFTQLADEPLDTLRQLALTGVYPALPWVAYLCAGLAVGRALLTSRRTLMGITAIGIGLAVAAQTVSWLLLDVFGGRGQLEAVALRSMSADDFQEIMATGWSGTTPTDTWWWLATVAPHSSTPLDLVRTIGIALTVLGVCILVGRVTRKLLVPLAAAGSMTLTLYSLHLLMLSAPRLPGDLSGLLLQIAVLVPFAMLWRYYHTRGPLEEIVAWVTGTVRRAVEGSRRPRSSRVLRA